MRVLNFRQRSAEWLAARRGIPTASRFDEIITPQGKRSGAARKYMYELAYERITDRLFERRNLTNIAHVQHGIDNEDTAVQAFEEHTGRKTAPVGFIIDDAGTVGCSPDRLIKGSNSALEIKCPTGPVHVGYLIDGLANYKAQIQGQMLIGRFRNIHFFSWHPELPPFYELCEPDPAFIAMLEKYLTEFEIELAAGVAHIRSLGSWPRNAPSAFPEPDDDDPLTAA